MECDNPDCGQLYCAFCVNMKLYDKSLAQNDKNCDVCKKANGGYRQPSALIVKMINKYRVRCGTCSKAFDLKILPQHEVMCQQSVCSNELCRTNLLQDQVIIDPDDSVDQVIARNIDQPANRLRFSIMGEEFVACSAKCKKVTKFAYMLRQQSEQEILRAFETMLRKKAKKQSQGAQQKNVDSALGELAQSRQMQQPIELGRGESSRAKVGLHMENPLVSVQLKGYKS